MSAPSSPPDRLISDTIALDKDAIVAFAKLFDPQPYHFDTDAAKESIFGGLCASGWHIAALATRLMSETLLANGLPFLEMTSVSHLKWHRPTFVNDQISVRVALGSSHSQSPIADTSIQALEVEVCDGDGEVVAEMSATAAIATGPSAGAAP